MMFIVMDIFDSIACPVLLLFVALALLAHARAASSGARAVRPVAHGGVDVEAQLHAYHNADTARKFSVHPSKPRHAAPTLPRTQFSAPVAVPVSVPSMYPSQVPWSEGRVRGDAVVRGLYVKEAEEPSPEDEGEDDVEFLSEVIEEDPTAKPGWDRKAEENQEMKDADQVGINATDYSTFIDAEGFDGGDGQVGVVGDDDNALQKFETDEVYDAESQNVRRVVGESVRGSESKKAKTVVDFGYTSGYAEKLKEEGMVDIDVITGEDKLQVRRQQLENYSNQQKVRAQRMKDVGQSIRPKTMSHQDQMAAMSKAKKQAEKALAIPVDEDHVFTTECPPRIDLIEETLELKTDQLGKFPVTHELPLINEAMGYEDFQAGFVEGSDPHGMFLPPLGSSRDVARVPTTSR